MFVSLFKIYFNEINCNEGDEKLLKIFKIKIQKSLWMEETDF